MALTAGAVSQVSVSQSGAVSSAVLLSGVATGGTGPYTYQWYMSTTSGFTPGGGNLVAGATTAGANQSFTGLSPSTNYFFKVVATDTGNSNATIISSQLSVNTLIANTTVVLKAVEVVHVIDSLGDKKVALELISCITNRTTPSANSIKWLSVALTDNLGKGGVPMNGSATYELLSSILTGKTLSEKTARKFAYMISSKKLALKVLNMIQTSPSITIRI